MQLPAPIQVRVAWRSGANAPVSLRERVETELCGLAWELSQAEVLLDDVTRIAGHERAYLMPRLELRLPLYDADRRLRIIFMHVDTPRIHLVDEEGKRLADIALR